MGIKWVDFRDATQPTIRLKVAMIEGVHHLLITGISHASTAWTRAIDVLGFKPGHNRRYLVMRVAQTSAAPKLLDYRKVWPNSIMVEVEPSQVVVDLSKNRKEQPRTQIDPQTEIDLTLYVRLGRNAAGDEVYDGSAGRIVRTTKGQILREGDLPGTFFLRASNDPEIATCADGIVRSIELGEVQYSDDFARLVNAVYSDESAAKDTQRCDRVQSHIEAALLRHVRARHALALDAYGEAARLYDLLPPFGGAPRGEAAMPLPVSIISQRLLGDTSGQRVLIPNAFDGAAYSHLAEGTKVFAFRGQRDLSSVAVKSAAEVTWGDEAQLHEHSGAQALFFNADPVRDGNGNRSDYVAALRHLRALAPGARVVLTLAGDDPHQAGVVTAESQRFLTTLNRMLDIEDVFEVASPLMRKCGSSQSLRIFSLRNRKPSAKPSPLLAGANGQAFPHVVHVCHDWNEVKTRVDEIIEVAQVREKEANEEIALDPSKVVQATQKPYLPLSKLGEARTMVPANLEAPIRAALMDVEKQFGQIDAFVSEQLGFMPETLAKRLSPEQIDAVGLCIGQILRGRSTIVEDETGIGKGRTLASMATWANKQGKNVVFITNTANLYTDFFGDLGDLNERGRFRTLVLNSNEPVFDKNDPSDPPAILVQGSKVDRIQEIVDGNLSMEEVGVNLVLATYSQINQLESDKAVWLKNQLANALLIVDESHVAAGSDSNISQHVAEMVELSWGTLYSSATWAKSAENLQIYRRAFPNSVNFGALTRAMRVGGESFAEVFSSMLARDGSLLRREHDLSRLEVEIVVDDQRMDYNVAVSDSVAMVLNAMALLSGDITRTLGRMNYETVEELKKAHLARTEVVNEIRQALETRLEHEIEGLDAPGRGANRSLASRTHVNLLRSSFGSGSVLYQVNRKLLASLNAPHVADLACEALSQGMRPVVVFDDTSEALVTALLNEEDGTHTEDGAQTVVQPTIRHLLHRLLDRMDRIRVEPQKVQDVLEKERARKRGRTPAAAEAAAATAAAGATEPADPNAAAATGEGGVNDEAAQEPDLDAVVQEILDGQGLGESQSSRGRRRGAPYYVKFADIEGIPAQANAIFEEGLQRIRDLINAVPAIPVNSADVVQQKIRERGYSTGEISGRKFALHPIEGVEGRCRVVPRVKKKSAVTATVRAFQNGLIDAVVINRSAATGLGLHAQPRFADPRKRNMIWLQAPENPTDVTQLAGRCNRYDQLTPPKMTFAATGLYGELRQIMTHNKKQIMMACNVRSTRESGIVRQETPDLLNKIGQAAIRNVLQDNPGYCQRMGISQDMLDSTSVDLTAWLNRVPMLAHAEQRRIYEDIFAAFDDEMLSYELRGFNPLRPQEIDIRAQVTQMSVLLGAEDCESAFDGPVHVERLDWTRERKPLSWARSVEMVLDSRKRLLTDARVSRVGDTPAGMPVVGMNNICDTVCKQFDGLARIALSATSLGSIQEVQLAAAQAGETALPRNIASVVRPLQRKEWCQVNLPRMVPGADVILRFSNDWEQRYMVVDVHLPPPGREYQLNRWKVHLLRPGMEKPLVYSASTLVDGDRDGSDVRLVRGWLGIDFFDGANKPFKNFVEDFDRAPSGVSKESAFALTGNMYMASDWAAATKVGRGMIFTDDKLVRHRGILLDSRLDENVMAVLPVRLWSAEQIGKVLDRWLRRELNPGKTLNLFTAFRAALPGVSHDGQVLSLSAGGGSAKIYTDKRSLARSRRLVVSELGRRELRRKREGGAPAPYSLKVSASNQRRNEFGTLEVGLDASVAGTLTDEVRLQACKEALSVIVNAIGVEAYVAVSSPEVEDARAVLQEYFQERKRLGRQGPGSAQGQQTPASDEAGPAGSAEAQPEPEPRQRIAA